MKKEQALPIIMGIVLIIVSLNGMRLQDRLNDLNEDYIVLETEYDQLLKDKIAVKQQLKVVQQQIEDLWDEYHIAYPNGFRDGYLAGYLDGYHQREPVYPIGSE